MNPTEKEQLQAEKDSILEQQRQLQQQMAELDTKLGIPDMTLTQRNMAFLTKPPKINAGDNFSNYCERFKAYVEMTGLTTNIDLLFLQNVDNTTFTTLKASARELTNRQKSDVNLLCKAFSEAMYGEESFTLRNQLLNMSQNASENITEFCNRIQEAANTAYSNTEQADEASLMTLLRGIRDITLKTKMNEAIVKTFPEAKRLAKRLESVSNMVKGTNQATSSTVNFASDNRGRSQSPHRKNSRHRSPTPYRNKGRDKSRDRSRDRSKDRSRNRSRDRSRDRHRSNSRDKRSGGNKLKCWNCGKQGHFQRHCNLN